MKIIKLQHIYFWLKTLVASFKFKAVISLVFAIGVPFLFWTLTRSSISILLLLVVSLLTSLLQIIRTQKKRRTNHFLGYISLTVTVSFGLLIIITITVIPFSAYKLWFEAMNQGTASGTVSNIFTLLSVFFASFLSANIVNKGYTWTVLILGLFVSGLSAIIWQKDLLYLCVLISSLGCLMFLLLTNREPSNLLKRFGFGLLFFVSCLICTIIISGNQSAAGNRFIDFTIHPELRRYVSHNIPNFPLLYGIPGYGYSFQERSLGGSPVLSPLPIFHIKVKNTERLYLKTDVFDFFNGKNWGTSTELSNGNQKNEILLLQGNPDRNNDNIQIELLIEFYNKIPFTLETKKIWVTSQSPLLETANSLQTFHLKEPLKSGQSVYLEQGKEQSAYLPKELKEIYLQTPNNISNEIKEIAVSMAYNSTGPEEILSNIDTYLSKTCIYSLNIENLKRSEIFIDKFVMEERKGYCVHFATTFAIMARLNNIPTRYNTGFLVNFPPGKKKTDVTGLAAHAWPEIWKEGQGWITWEATPAVTPTQYSNYFNEEEFLSIYGFEMEMDTFTLRQVESILGDRTVAIPTEISENKLDKPKLNWKLSVLLSGLILSVSTLVLLFFRFRKIKNTNRGLGKLMIIVQKYLLLAYTFRIKHPKKTGWNLWLSCFQNEILFKNVKLCLLLQRSVVIINQVVYGEKIVSNRDTIFLKKLFLKLLIYRFLHLNHYYRKS